MLTRHLCIVQVASDEQFLEVESKAEDHGTRPRWQMSTEWCDDRSAKDAQ